MLNRTPQMRISFVDRCAALLCTWCALFAFAEHDMHSGPATEQHSFWGCLSTWWSPTFSSLLVERRQCRGGETRSSLNEFYSTVVRVHQRDASLFCVWVFCMQHREQPKVTFLFWFLTMDVMHLCPLPHPHSPRRCGSLYSFSPLSSNPLLHTSFLVGHPANDLADCGPHETRFNHSSGRDWVRTNEGEEETG